MRESIIKRMSVGLLLLLMVFAVCQLGSADAMAASIGRPVINSHSAYMNDSIYLQWSKAKGAKKYEIQRAKVSRKGKPGTWKKWAVTKKLSIKKKGSGDYIYRVRGVKGSKKGNWSGARRIFGANAVITQFIYEPARYFWESDSIYARILLSNKTTSDMGFVSSGYYFGAQGALYAVDSATGKAVRKWDARLYIGEIGGVAKTVQAGKQQSIYADIDISGEEYETYKNYNLLLTFSFYPNPYTEPMANQMAFACTQNVADSAIACKKLVQK